MLDDFRAIVHELEPRTIKVWAIADVHIGSKECDMDGFSKFLKAVQADKNSYIVLVGDIINNGIKDSLTNVYEETIPPSMQIDKAVEMLLPVADKILGAVGGNHENRSRKQVDINPMEVICHRLGIPELYRENMAFVKINMRDKSLRESYSLLLTHGKSANAKRRFAYSLEGIDAVISGHTHDGILEKPARLIFTAKGNVLVRSLVSLTATSWLSYGGYGAASMYQPKATSDPQHLILEWTKTNRKRGEIRCVW